MGYVSFDKELVETCVEAMFKDPLFKGERTDYDIFSVYADECSWTVTLMSNHEPQRLYIFNNMGDDPIAMWTYTKTNTKIFENLGDLEGLLLPLGIHGEIKEPKDDNGR